jgi:hypothetical protein
MMERFELFADMSRFIGKTVTIFTTSGGISGSGFTGVLACVDENVVKLITRVGAPPACPVGLHQRLWPLGRNRRGLWLYGQPDGGCGRHTFARRGLLYTSCYLIDSCFKKPAV